MQIITAHATGINWSQGLSIWVPIVAGMLGIMASVAVGARSFKKWREEREDKIQAGTKELISEFGKTLGVRFDGIESHLARQDERISRIDRNTGTDST